MYKQFMSKTAIKDNLPTLPFQQKMETYANLSSFPHLLDETSSKLSTENSRHRSHQPSSKKEKEKKKKKLLRSDSTKTNYEIQPKCFLLSSLITSPRDLSSAREEKEQVGKNYFKFNSLVIIK